METAISALFGNAYIASLVLEFVPKVGKLSIYWKSYKYFHKNRQYVVFWFKILVCI